MRAPRLPSHTWRPLRREDAAPLHRLELACAPLDGGTNLATIADLSARLDETGTRLTTDTLCLVDPTGELAASAWVTCDEGLRHQFRFFLDGRVHPQCRGRGLGSFVLQWMESRASEMLSELNEARPGVLRIDFYDRADDAMALFERQGFRFAFAEDEMWRDLSQPLPALEVPDGMDLVTWSPRSTALFFEAYQDSFRERPGFPHWSEEVWCHNYSGGASFRADLSVLLLEGGDPVGYAISHVETGAVGWIVQMGVRPAWRHQGLGAALLCEVMRRFQDEGLRWAALEVNVDNDRAFRLYQRLRFERRTRHTSYQKPLGSHSMRDGANP